MTTSKLPCHCCCLQAPYRRDLPWLFFGEEAVQQLAMWQAGWDTYSPHCAIAFHLWSRKHRPTCQHGGSQAAEQQRQRSQQLVAAVLAGQAGGVGSGGSDSGGVGARDAPALRSVQAFW